VIAVLEKFCKFDEESMSVAAEGCMMNPPGAPPMPIGDMMGMMGALKAGPFPKWTAKFHGVEKKNDDGTYSVLTQQCPGALAADFPAMGPFPHVAFDSVPEVVKTEDLANPIEVGTYTLSEDKSKVTICAYDISSHTGHSKVGGASPSVEPIWGKAGDGSDTGFGCYFKLMGVPWPPAPP